MENSVYGYENLSSRIYTFQTLDQKILTYKYTHWPFLGATVNAVLVQVLLFSCFIFTYILLRKRHINIYHATGILFCILLTQYLIFAGSSDINIV